MIYFSFETSCDETSVAVLKNDDQLLSVSLPEPNPESHKRFGGIGTWGSLVTMWKSSPLCIEEALEEAGSEADVTAVAVTYGQAWLGLF